MELLQGFQFALFMLFYIVDAFSSCPGSCHSGHVWHLGFDGCLAEVAVVMHAVFAYRGVDDQLNVSVGDHIQDIWSAFIEFFHLFRLYAGFDQKVIGTSGGDNSEPVIHKDLCDICHFWFVLSIYGNQNSAGQGKGGLDCLLGLVKCFAIGGRQSQNLSGGTHLRTQYRIHLLEHIEGERCLLYSVIWNILLLKSRDGGFFASQF